MVTQTLELKSKIFSDGNVSSAKICCLIVRYGTDLYFEKLASDQERYEGRLQNRILQNWVVERWAYDNNDRLTLLKGLRYLWYRLRGRRVIDASAESIQTLFHLPIHERLGTQFKFFFEIVEQEPKRRGILLTISDKIQEVERREKYFKLRLQTQEILDAPELLVTLGENAEQAAAAASAPNAEKLFDADSKAYKLACSAADAYGLPHTDIVRRYKSVGWRKSVLCYRLWFTLADFPRVRTADGLENNMAFPI